MKIKYDKSVDSALIFFGEDNSVETLELRPGSGIFVDFNLAGEIVMIEVHDASERLSESVLAVAELAIDESTQLLMKETN